MLKAVFLDIDGTLVSLNTHRIPESTVRALELLRQKGVRLFICSGRPYCAIDNLDGQQFDGFITVNGGICSYDGKVLYRNPIVREDIAKWKTYLEKSGIDCFFITENQVYMNRPSETADQFIRLLNFMSPEIRTPDSLAGEPIFQMVGLFEKDRDADVQKALPHCRITRWHPTFSDIISKDNDKCVAMKVLLEYMKISPSECMAFGDGSNDMGMLRYAGLGVAMGGCGDDVRDAADYVTDSADDDGIWNALKHFSVI